jgi:hypothetical protein
MGICGPRPAPVFGLAGEPHADEGLPAVPVVALPDRLPPERTAVSGSRPDVLLGFCESVFGAPGAVWMFELLDWLVMPPDCAFNGAEFDGLPLPRLLAPPVPVD